PCLPLGDERRRCVEMRGPLLLYSSDRRPVRKLGVLDADHTLGAPLCLEPDSDDGAVGPGQAHRFRRGRRADARLDASKPPAPGLPIDPRLERNVDRHVERLALARFIRAVATLTTLTQSFDALVPNREHLRPPGADAMLLVYPACDIALCHRGGVVRVEHALPLSPGVSGLGRDDGIAHPGQRRVIDCTR